MKNFFDSSVWDEFDEKYPNTGLDAKKFDHFNSYLESIGYTVKEYSVPERETSLFVLTKDSIIKKFNETEFNEFQNEIKKSVDYQFWLKTQKENK